MPGLGINRPIRMNYVRTLTCGCPEVLHNFLRFVEHCGIIGMLKLGQRFKRAQADWGAHVNGEGQPQIRLDTGEAMNRVDQQNFGDRILNAHLAYRDQMPLWQIGGRIDARKIIRNGHGITQV